ncbi:hypothetical protein WA588_002052 [Blastocystis sp. NMH]
MRWERGSFTSSSLGNLTPEEFTRYSSDESNQHLLIGFVSEKCVRCQDYFYPLVQALHAFRGVDIVIGTANVKDVKDLLGNCDINVESELPEFRLYKANTGVCLESPDRQFDLKWVAKELNVKMKPSRWTELTDRTYYKFVTNPHKNAIIEVYAPRCISCQNQYNDLERILVAFDSEPVHFGKIDSDRYRRFCSQFNITTLPHFLYYPIGKPYTANQPTVQGDSAMVDYFNKLLGTQREIDGRISDRFGLERNITRQLDRFMNVCIYETSKRQGDRSMKESVMEDVRNHMKEYKNAKLYLHIMKHVMSEGKGFLKEEKAKRTKLVREVGVFSRKYPMNKVYLNILNTFMKYDFSGLVALTGDNFDKIVNGKRNVLCVFYKKDCETCEAFKKERGAANRGVPGVIFASLNADKYNYVAKRFNHHKNPSLKWFGKGADVNTPEEVQIPHTKEAFLEYVNDRMEDLKEDENESEL